MAQMARPKNDASTPQAPAAAALTSPAFQPRKAAERGSALTRERIAGHLEAFRDAGGVIEVLGTTQTLQRIGLPADAVPEPPAAQGKGRPRRSSR